jgi:hypothetical protein
MAHDSRPRQNRATLPQYGLAVPLIGFLLAALGRAGEADSPEARARAVAEAQLRFAAYVFEGDQFPACDFEQPDKVKPLLGTYKVRATYYDGKFRQVEKPGAPGPYAAVVEVVPGEGRPLRRFATL